MGKAIIVVEAYNVHTALAVKDAKGRPIVVRHECTADIPAGDLGEASAWAMQRAWRTGLDGKDITLTIRFE